MFRIPTTLALLIGLVGVPATVHAQDTDSPPSPAAERPPLRATPPGVDVRFDPSSPGLTLLRQTGVTPKVYVPRWNYYREQRTPVYTPLCTGPCDQRLLPGEHRFALARPGGTPIIADRPVRIDGPVELRGEYVDRRLTRTAGAVVAIAGPLGGLAMILAGTYQGGGNVCDYYGVCYDKGDDNNHTLRTAGAVTLVGTLLIGSVLLMQNDRARFEVAPLAPVARRESVQIALGGEPAPQGAAVQWRF